MAFQSELETSRLALVSETSTEAPPAEVLEEIATAARTNEQLSSSGRQVCFSQDEQSGRVTVELRGREGNMLRTLSIAETLDIAAGNTAELGDL